MRKLFDLIFFASHVYSLVLRKVKFPEFYILAKNFASHLFLAPLGATILKQELTMNLINFEL